MLVMWADALLHSRSLLMMDKAAGKHLQIPYSDQLNSLHADVVLFKNMHPHLSHKAVYLFSMRILKGDSSVSPCHIDPDLTTSPLFFPPITAV